MIQSTSDREKGVALITVVLMTALVVGLISLVVTNSMVETVVTTTYTQVKQNEECGHGNLDLAKSVFFTLYTEGLQGLQGVSGMQINDNAHLMTEIGGGDFAVGAHGGGTYGGENKPLDSDDVEINPDFTILPTQAGGGGTQNCQTQVDIDGLYQKETEGSSVDEVVSGYYSTSKGTACPDGMIYSITTLASNIQNNTVEPFRSVYYKCPG